MLDEKEMEHCRGIWTLSPGHALSGIYLTATADAHRRNYLDNNNLKYAGFQLDGSPGL